MIGKRGERGSGISVLVARHDDNEIFVTFLDSRIKFLGKTGQEGKNLSYGMDFKKVIFDGSSWSSGLVDYPKGSRGCPRGVMVKAMDCGIVVHMFVLQSRYYVRFRANTLGKGMNPLILPAMG